MPSSWIVNVTFGIVPLDQLLQCNVRGDCEFIWLPRFLIELLLGHANCHTRGAFLQCNTLYLRNHGLAILLTRAGAFSRSTGAFLWAAFTRSKSTGALFGTTGALLPPIEIITLYSWAISKMLQYAIANFTQGPSVVLVKGIVNGISLVFGMPNSILHLGSSKRTIAPIKNYPFVIPSTLPKLAFYIIW